jgi:hypothetical protein
MRSTLAKHARAQSAAIEPRFDLIADVDERCIAYQRAIRRPRNDRKTARECRQGADGIQGALGEPQAMLGTRNRREKRVAQAPRIEFMSHPQVAHQPVRRMAHQASEDFAQAPTLVVQFRAQRMGNALLEVI